MPLIKNGQIVEDPWVTLDDDAPLPATDPVIVSLARFRAHKDALLSRRAPLGVRLKSAELASEIGGNARELDLIAIEFPTFRDGRGYSTARLLRERWGFAGELRAVGNVLRDQLLFMYRCGFDAFEIAHPDVRSELLDAASSSGIVRRKQRLRSRTAYPVAEVREARLRDGRKMQVRPTRTSDTGATLRGSPGGSRRHSGTSTTPPSLAAQAPSTIRITSRS